MSVSSFRRFTGLGLSHIEPMADQEQLPQGLFWCEIGEALQGTKLSTLSRYLVLRSGRDLEATTLNVCLII